MTASEAIEGIKQLNKALKFAMKDQDYILAADLKNKIRDLLKYI